MRQAGVLATCGLISLENWQEQLENDNQNALWLANALAEVNGMHIDPSQVQTNIFRFTLSQESLKKFDHGGFCDHLRVNHQILMNPTFKNDAIRIVTHRDVSKEQLKQLVVAFKASL